MSNKKARNIILTVLEVFFIAITIFALVMIVKIYLSYREGDEIYDDAKNTYVIAEARPDDEDNFYFTIDLEGLKKINKDIIGWICIPNTPVDYPLLAPDNNSYYLKHTYDNRYSDFGSIFVDCNSSFSDKNTLIYGHNTRNDSMFGSLKKYKDPDYYKNHQYLYILNGTEEKKYHIIAGLTVEVTDPVYIFNMGPVSEQKRWLQSIIDRSEVPTLKENDVTGDEKVITLSTCTSRTKTERFVIIAEEVDIVWEG